MENNEIILFQYELPRNMLYAKYYVFNVENPDEIKNGSRPRVTQYGPYVYQEYRRKEDIVEIGEDKIFYGQYIEYVFDEKETQRSGCFNGQDGVPCKKTDNVQVINYSLVAIVDLIQSLPAILLPPNNTTLPSAILTVLEMLLFPPGCKMHLDPPLNLTHCDDLFYNVTVDDLIWQGHNPGIIKLIFAILQLIEDMFEKIGIDIDLDQFIISLNRTGKMGQMH